MSHRLRRLANRRRAAAADLARDNPPAVGANGADATEPLPFLADEIRTATEIGSLAACLRSNRKLRAALERALEANPPLRIRRKLEGLRDETDLESATLNRHLGELANPVVPVPANPEGSEFD
jgi:hypothetical protein